jgi:hypothetical protein
LIFFFFYVLHNMQLIGKIEAIHSQWSQWSTLVDSPHFPFKLFPELFLLFDSLGELCDNLVAPCDVCCSLGLPWRCSIGARFGNLFFHLSYHVPHHIIFLLVIMIDTSGLSLHMLSLLENPFTFFTNTRHLLQCYQLSFSMKKDCIFPCNTVVNIDMAPHLLV